MAIIFLDQDDEITTAIARLRASQDIKVALVLPPGSRLGTSRINFRLLAREAQDLPRQASIVTTEAGVRAIAVSAGLPAYASVAEFEAAAEAAAAAASAAASAAPSSDESPIPGAAAAVGIGVAGAGAAAVGAGAPAAAAGAPATVAAGLASTEPATPAEPAAPAVPESGPAVETPPAEPEPAAEPVPRVKRSRTKKAAAAAAVVAAADVATAEVAAADGAAASVAAADVAAADVVEATPPQPAPDIGPDGPTIVTATTTLAGATADVDADAAAGAFGAEVASVPPAPRGPGPRSSAALPVVGGPVRSTGVLGGRGAIVGVLAVLAAVGVVALALAVVVLPQATITVAAPIETIGPVSRTLTADPTAIEPDPVAGIIPAELVRIPLSAQGDFTATGVKVTETKAKGSVTFSNFDTGGKRTVPAGSIVATDSDVRFRTLATASMAKAKVIGGTTIVPGNDSVRVEAVKAGTDGNVPANAIHNVPAGQDPVLLKVTNGAATRGGDRTESSRISQEDVDVAVAELTKELESQMAAALAAPETAPAGTTLVEETAKTGRVKADPALGGLVGKSARTFSLKLSNTGEVIAVDTGVLEPLAADALTAAVPEGVVLFPGSIRTTVGTPTVDGGVVSFEIGATGDGWRPLDEAALLGEVRGLPVVEAEEALAAYGEVVVDVWPFYVATIPDGDRATLTVIPPTPSGP